MFGLGLSLNLSHTGSGEGGPTVPLADHVFRADASESDDALTAAATNLPSRTALMSVVESGDVLTATATFVAADTVPDTYTFNSLSDAPVSTSFRSAPITVAGVSAASPISVTGGDYQINAGAWTSTSGTVGNGDAVRVRVLSSSSHGTAASVTLTIGGVSAAYTVTTTTVTAERSIFGFYAPAVPPTLFAGQLMTTAEQTGADLTSWSKQSNDAALTLAEGAFGASGAQTAARYIRFTDDEIAAVNDRIAFVPKIETASTANTNLTTSNIGTPNNTGNIRVGWKQGQVVATAAVAPTLQVTYSASAIGSFSQMRAYNLTTLLARKQFLVAVAGAGNVIGATATADPTIDTPVEGCVAIPGVTNSYVGATAGAPMLALDPIPHQTTNGSNVTYGGGPCGSYLRELRKRIPDDYAIVLVAGGFAGATIKTGGSWYKSTTLPVARDGFFAAAAAAWAAAPPGSIMGGLLTCFGDAELGAGGESDYANTSSGWPSLVTDFRALYGAAAPVVMLELGGDPATTNVASMITLQRKYRTGSGDALALDNCAYVSRPTGWVLTDGTNYDQPTHRLRGRDAAVAHLGIIYPPLSGSNFADDFDDSFG